MCTFYAICTDKPIRTNVVWFIIWICISAIDFYWNIIWNFVRPGKIIATRSKSDEIAFSITKSIGFENWKTKELSNLCSSYSIVCELCNQACGARSYASRQFSNCCVAPRAIVWLWPIRNLTWLHGCMTHSHRTECSWDQVGRLIAWCCWTWFSLNSKGTFLSHIVCNNV